MINESALILAIAALLDYLIGDPWNWLHPVQVMGWVIKAYSHAVFKRMDRPAWQKLAGIGLGILMIGGSGFVGWGIVWTATRLHPVLGIGVQCVLLASCLAGRSLRAAAEDVLKPLMAGDVAIARSKLSLYVGRDTENLSEAEILRAVLETVTENATDGVMAPLFYAIVGSLLPIGSVPLALAYKAASTLDSMVGYREVPYTHLGWFSAKTEDVLTWIPCRLVVLTLSLLSAQPLRVWQICWRDARHDPSPNAGWSECAYAVALGVQVGGINQYRGVVKEKPLLGDPLRPITSERVERAIALTRYSVLLWLAIALGLHLSL
ncbi:MAG TPA: adenosylcobinamide-phosphate synthase CbiB [Crinalium sp.]